MRWEIYVVLGAMTTVAAIFNVAMLRALFKHIGIGPVGVTLLAGGVLLGIGAIVEQGSLGTGWAMYVFVALGILIAIGVPRGVNADLTWKE